MPTTPSEEMLDAVTEGVCAEWRPYRRQQARALYLAFVAHVKTSLDKESTHV
jgi:hypothetical protein